MRERAKLYRSKLGEPDDVKFIIAGGWFRAIVTFKSGGYWEENFSVPSMRDLLDGVHVEPDSWMVRNK